MYTLSLKKKVNLFILCFLVIFSFNVFIPSKKTVVQANPIAIPLTMAGEALLGTALFPVVLGAIGIGGLYYLNKADVKIRQSVSVLNKVVEALTDSDRQKINELAEEYSSSSGTSGATIPLSELPTNLVQSIAYAMGDGQIIINTTVPTVFSNRVAEIDLNNKNFIEGFATAFPSYSVEIDFSNTVTRYSSARYYIDGRFLKTGTGTSAYRYYIPFSCSIGYGEQKLDFSSDVSMFDVSTPFMNPDIYITSLNSVWNFQNTFEFRNNSTTFPTSVSSEIIAKGFPIPYSQGGSICYYPPIRSTESLGKSISIPTSIPLPAPLTDEWKANPALPVTVPGVDVYNPSDSVSIPISEPVSIPDEGTGAIPTDWSVPNTATLNFAPLQVAFSEKFPFCLPFDFINGIKSLVTPATAPVWEVNFDKNYYLGGGSFRIDFNNFSKLATILRYFLSLGWVYTLILLTKRLKGD